MPESLARAAGSWLDRSMMEPVSLVRMPLLPHAPPWALHGLRVAGAAVGRGLHSIAQHTGIPVSIVAAIALVVSLRLARRASHLALEVALAIAVVLAATRAGWLRF